MLKFIKYLAVGIVFGITLSKAEVISWYRIFEMFQFDAFHMYGVIGSAVVIGIIGLQIIKYFNIKSFDGEAIHMPPKKFSWTRYILGGLIFGFGWALTGACPGPLFILVGNGVDVAILMILSALLGTYCYGLLRNSLPH